MHVRRHFFMTALFAMLLSAGLFASLQPAPAHSEGVTSGGFSAECVAISSIGKQTLQQAIEGVLDGNRPFNEEEIMAPDQLLLTGSLDAIDDFSATVRSELSIELVRSRQVISLAGHTIGLFAIVGGSDEHAHSVRRLLCEAVRMQETGIFSGSLRAEPNYVVSASPWWAGGSRWRDDALSQYTLEHSGPMLTTYDAFQSQWALGPAGVNLQIDGRRTISQSGAGVTIAIFDSAPFDRSGVYSFTTAVEGQSIPILTLQTRLPYSLTSGAATDAFSDHGPYVAALAHAVAPAAQLELVRVLNNENGRATLFDLLTAIDDWLDDQEDATQDEPLPLKRTVMNFSLGLHHPVVETFPGLTVTDTFGLPSQVLSFGDVLRHAHALGATIVAAAGNDFAFGDDGSPWSESPASYDFVISVGGSTIAGERSCFSNNGTLFAPGGEAADADCSGPPAELCASNPTGCMVSLVHQESVDNAAFAYWIGSSFAAPQVSGLAALLIDYVTAAGTDPAARPDADKILAAMQCGAGDDGLQVIDVKATFDPDCLALLRPAAGQVRFSQAAIDVGEEAGAVQVTVERVNGSTGELRVNWATLDGSATPSEDYPASAGTLLFADAVIEQTITISIADNSTQEENETFLIRLSGLSTDGDEIGAPDTITVTIIDDDFTPPAALRFSSALYSVAEDAERATISVVRDGGSVDEVRVSYRTENGSAEAGKDYMPALGTLTFALGETLQTFEIPLLDDAGEEADETVLLALENLVGVAIFGEPTTAVLTIVDNDGQRPQPEERATYLPLLRFGAEGRR